MRSNLFSVYDYTRSETFLKDAAVFVELSPDEIKGMTGWLMREVSAETPRLNERVRDEAARELNIDRGRLNHCLDLSGFFLRQFAGEGDAAEDDPHAVAQDFAELVGEVATSKLSALAEFFRTVKLLAQGDGKLLLRRRKYADSGLQRVRGISVSVDYRVVFDEEYEDTKSVSAFEPKCLGVLPIGIVRIRLTDGPVEHVIFQADVARLEIMVQYLQALKKQMEIAQRSLNLEEPVG